MKQYFLKLELNQPKNKAQKAAQKFAEQYQDCLIDESRIEGFKTLISLTLQVINKEHPNCADLSFSTGKLWRDEHEHTITIDGGIYFTLRSVKRYELATTGRDPILDHYGDMKADAQ